MAKNAFTPWKRAAYLKTVDAKHLDVAVRLCDLLERYYPVSDIRLYGGFPIVVRDMEWIAGFAMRKKGPMVYCCSPTVLKQMSKALKPFMDGKSCMALKAKPKLGLTLEDAFAVAERAFKLASTSHGMISKTDMKKRDRLRKAAK